MSRITPESVIFVLGGVALIAALPLAVQGWRRRGSGETYEASFWIQRAPQIAVLLNALLIERAFSWGAPWSVFPYLPAAVSVPTSWIGVALYGSGLAFLIGGWYSLGANFSLDAEIVRGQTVSDTGLYRVVMHPAYSGVAQALIGAGLASGALLALLFAAVFTAPLGMRRAFYEESLLLDRFGKQYERYAESVGWRRIVPRFIPIGF